MDELKGLSWCLRAVQSELKSENDVVVVAIHVFLTNGGFKCLGVGENFEAPDSSESEFLPANWNQDQNAYVLRYVKNEGSKSEKLLVKVVKDGETLFVNVLHLPQETTTAVLKASNFVTDRFRESGKEFKEGEKSMQSILKLLKSELFVNLHKQNLSEERHETNNPPPTPKPHAPQSGYHPVNPEPGYDGGVSPPGPRIGGQDLDPFGSRSGGMIFDPFRGGPPRVGPRGPGHPPGARFDPIGPPGVGPGRPRPRPREPRAPGEPNPDHLPPPGYDDMFM